MADVGVEGLDPGAEELQQGGFPEEIDAHQFLLVDLAGLDVHGFFVGQHELRLPVRTLSRNYLGHRFCHLLLLQALYQVLEALEVLPDLFAHSIAQPRFPFFQRVFHPFGQELDERPGLCG